ncbi:MAG: ABC transporter ATP-binding protein [Acidimicrobiia bacterium]
MALSLLELRSVSRIYGQGVAQVSALSDVSLRVEAGEFVAVTGPSGSGKTTLLNILGLLDRPDRGDYLLQGESTGELSEVERARLRGSSLGFIFQAFNLIPERSALENVELGLRYRDLPKRARTAAARAALNRVGLEARLDHLPRELSGGEQQRTAIARAIVGGRSLLLCDEPTGNLDSETAHEVLKLLVSLNQAGATVVLVTHNLAMAGYAHRMVSLADGSVA